MRKFITIFLAAFIAQFALKAQTPISYSNVEKIEGISASQLFLNAKQWVATNYVSANDVIQMANDNIIVLKANYLYDSMSGHHILDYTFTIECRDGRYKWTIDRIFYSCRWMTNPKIFQFGILTDAETTKENASFFGSGKCAKFWQTAQDESRKLQTLMSESLLKAMKQSRTQTEESW